MTKGKGEEKVYKLKNLRIKHIFWRQATFRKGNE
jgi:hypothetical protein